MRAESLLLLPNLNHLNCRRILFRESDNLFELCPRLQVVVCTRLNYESLFALPDGVQLQDEEQRQRYLDLTDMT